MFPAKACTEGRSEYQYTSDPKTIEARPVSVQDRGISRTEYEVKQQGKKTKSQDRSKKTYCSAAEFQKDFQAALRSGISPSQSARRLLGLARKGNPTAVKLVTAYQLGVPVEIVEPSSPSTYHLKNLTVPEVRVLRWLLAKSRSGEDPGPVPAFIPGDDWFVQKAWNEFWEAYLSARGAAAGAVVQ